jgi:uroporphyrin-III C-methyltransferase/precorrin-2 dehydrogenase/sirohydrochlorin ferrochelatase
MVRRIREKIEGLLPVRLGALARFSQSFRGAVSAAIRDGAGRRHFWERFFDGPVAQDVLEGRETAAREAMLRLVNAGEQSGPCGSVALVGAGPGDPDLLTLKALRLMQDADVIVHDALIGPSMLEYVRRDSLRIDVGKRAGRQSRTQDEINALLAEHAEAGRRVVRLKGGDPFIFGRGGEELAYLKARGIAVEVVPGVTAALGAASAAGLPLTHRDHANRLTILTGHDRNGLSDFDRHLLADPKGTLVIYMGLGAAPRIMADALAAGRSASTPVAVIEKATLPEQRVLKAQLGGLARLVEDERVEAPALIVIGDVAALADGEVFEAADAGRHRLAV